MKDYIVIWVFVTRENRSVRSVVDRGSIGWVGLHRGLLRGTSHASFHNKRNLQENAAFSMKAPGENFFVNVVKPLLCVLVNFKV